MAKFGYKNGCLQCNQCGRLYEDPIPGEAEKFECPCGNAEDLDAIQRLIEVYNRPPDRVEPEPDEQ